MVEISLRSYLNVANPTLVMVNFLIDRVFQMDVDNILAMEILLEQYK